MSGPDVWHRQLTSGQPATLATLGEDLHEAMRGVRSAIDDIVLAQDTPDWDSPTARTRFNMSAWATRAAAEMGHVRLNRTGIALRMVESMVRETVRDADALLEGWRRAKREQTSALIIKIILDDTMTGMRHLDSELDRVLAQARDFLAADGLSDDERAWLENGLARSLRYAVEHPEVPLGPTIPNTFATGDDDGGWTPQGLGYDPTSGTLLQTSYNEDGQAELSIVDPDTGELLQTVRLGEAPLQGYEKRAPDHAGGVVVHDGKVYVTSSQVTADGSEGDDVKKGDVLAGTKLYTYDLAALRSARPGDTVAPDGVPQPIEGAAYATVHDGVLYSGTFTKDPDAEGRLYRYRLDPASGQWTRFGEALRTPAQTQGVGIHDGRIYFSTSWGRDKTSHLRAYDLRELESTGRLGTRLRDDVLPNMSEGVAATPRGLLTTHESGASPYRTPGEADAGMLWAGTRMSVSPYVGGEGEIEVRPHTLREARTGFLHAEQTISTTAAQVGRLTLPSSAIADVSEAPVFAKAVVHQLDETARWLDEGRVTADLTAAGLVDAAEDYEETDSGIGGWLDRLTGGLL